MSLRVIDINVELGQKARQARSQVFQLSLSKPDKYNKLKSTIEENIVQEITKQIYELFTTLLTQGIITKKDGSKKQLYLDDSTMLDKYNPNIPISITEQFCINLCLGLEKDIYKCIDFMLPKSAENLANQKASDLLHVTTGV